MTGDDAIIYLRQMRDELNDRIYIGMTPEKPGEWLSKSRNKKGDKLRQQQYYQNRIEALDTAIVYLSLKL